MKKMVDCFLPMAGREELKRTLEGLQGQDIVNRVIILQAGEPTTVEGVDGVLAIDTLKSSDTMRKVAEAAEAPYTLLYMKEQYMEIGLYALERMVGIAQCTHAGMVYADHYKISAEGIRSESPVIDYQKGSLRDDFDFGSVLLFRTDALKTAAGKTTAHYQAAETVAVRGTRPHQRKPLQRGGTRQPKDGREALRLRRSTQPGLTD